MPFQRHRGLTEQAADTAVDSSERWVKAVAFPREKALRGFGSEADPHIDPAVLHTLATCDWVKLSSTRAAQAEHATAS
ncbi:hypothetical protein [Streptomyces sp. NPDC051132]|uniref:hypothetical protein n=1 Tax=unclassified Streptomyces TaxID=2593676 RepID=UPI00342EC231